MKIVVCKNCGVKYQLDDSVLIETDKNEVFGGIMSNMMNNRGLAAANPKY